jgi:UPF0716 protein FxsA
LRVLFILFALLPILEIALLINVGSVIGGWNTVGLVLLSAFIGAYFVKREGVSTLQTAQEKMQRNEVPGKELVEGLMLVVAGVLLVTPGFITDIFGFLLAMPGSRHFFAAQVSKHMKMRVVAGGWGRELQASDRVSHRLGKVLSTSVHVHIIAMVMCLKVSTPITPLTTQISA